jgi:putative transposase
MSANVKEPARRRRLRLRDYGYSRPGAYFITLCSHHRACLFGNIEAGIIETNPWGRVVAETWREQMDAPGHIRTDEWVLMPNHFHALVLIEWEEGGSRAAPTRTLGTIINAFKTVSAKRLNQLRGTPGVPVWQRNYYEHIVRTEGELERIRNYITDNPAKWDEDSENPQAKSPANRQDQSKR